MRFIPVRGRAAVLTCGLATVGVWTSSGSTLDPVTEEVIGWLDGDSHRVEKPLMRSSKPTGLSSALDLDYVSGEQEGQIPLIVYVTGYQKTMRGGLLELWNKNRKFLPPKTRIRYFNDADMAEDVRQVSRRLQRQGIVAGAFEAFSNLRPGAFRADLWRYMRLWDSGGIYADAKIELLADLQSWVSLTSSSMQVVKDWAPGMLYNGLIACGPGDPRLANVIHSVVQNIMRHSYGEFSVGMTCEQGGWDCTVGSPGYLAITGPKAFADGLGMTGVTGGKGTWTFSGFGLKGAKPSLTARIHVKVNETKKEAAVFIRDLSNNLVAKSNKGIHKEMNGSSYFALWHAHQVYCDEPGPPCVHY